MAERFGGSEVGTTHFKKPKKFIVNRYLYGIMLAEQVTIADLSDLAGVTRYAVREWIYNGRVPRDHTINKLCEVLDCPATILFNSAELYYRKQGRE